MKRRKAFRVVLFLLIGVMLFSLFWRVFRLKVGRSMQMFYDVPVNSIDVLFAGSSHAYRNIDPSVLYEDYGYSGYVIGTAAQPMWTTYYNVKEALKTQHPTVVVVECFKVYLTEDVSEEVTVRAASAMKPSIDRINMIKTGLTTDEHLIDTILEFPWFHSRYGELEAADIYPYYNSPEFYQSFLGFMYLSDHIPCTLDDQVRDVTQVREMWWKTEEYLRKLVDLSKEKGFELVFLVTPFVREAAERQPYYNALEIFSRVHNIPFINCNLLYKEIQLAPEKDFSNADHLNIWGADKITRYFGGFLNANYELPDHRGDPAYERWEKNAQFMRKLREGSSGAEGLEGD